MDIMHVIDKIIVPAQREGRLVFTNGGQWVIKTNCDIETLWVDITTLTPEVKVIDGRDYARQWGMPFPLPTRAADANATNWLRPRVAV